MPNTRMLLWFALAAILYFNYEAWMHDYPSGTPGAAAPSAAGNKPGTLGDSVPEVASPAPSTPAAAPTSVAPTAAERLSAPPSVAAESNAGPSLPLHVTTDVLDVVINLKGGELDQADLLLYPLRKDAPNVPVRLLSRDPPDTLYLLQSGLIGVAG